VRRTVDATALAGRIRLPALRRPQPRLHGVAAVHECVRCGYQCSVTAGTIFHRPHCSVQLVLGHLSHEPRQEGISAVQLGKEIGVSYPTAWLIEHKIRKAMEDRDQHYTLRGLVEVDEGYVGGEEHGEPRKGRGARNKRWWPWPSNTAPQASRAGRPCPIRRPVGACQRRLQQSGWLPQARLNPEAMC